MPAVPFFAPESCMPDEELLLYRPEHHQHQANRRQLGQHSKNHTQASGHFSSTQKCGEALTHTNTLAASFRIFQMVPAADKKNHADHKAQQQQAEVGKTKQLRNQHTASPITV